MNGGRGCRTYREKRNERRDLVGKYAGRFLLGRPRPRWKDITKIFLSCKANAKVKRAKTGHGSHSNFCVVLCIFVLFYVLFVLCSSLYCLCVYVYCTTATGWINNCS
jgi:hypothetical protein